MALYKAIAASALAVTLGAQSVPAASITNRDDRDHKVTIIVEGERNRDQILKPLATLDGICGKGCVVRLNDSESDEYELEGTEVVSIEDGYLYYDGPDVPAEPSSGEDAKAADPKK